MAESSSSQNQPLNDEDINSSFNSSFINPQDLYKNTRENQQGYIFVSNSYLIQHGLFNYTLSDINYNKERIIYLYYTYPDYNFSFKSKANRF